MGNIEANGDELKFDMLGYVSIVMEILFAMIVAAIGGCWLHKSLSRMGNNRRGEKKNNISQIEKWEKIRGK